MNSFKLVDRANRCLNYLRISITDRCNLKCIYCSPNDCYSRFRHTDLLTYEEILRLVKISTNMGITKIRITGGEPLTRKGVLYFIKSLTNFTNIVDLSITTNGVLLLENAKKIKESGINRINVSLDSLNRVKYKYITKHDKFDKVWKGIMYANEIGFNPIKINVVAIKGVNDDEILDFAKLSIDYPFHIRFIEYMPIGVNRMKLKYQFFSSEIKNKLSSIGKLRSIKTSNNDGPATRFKFNNSIGEIGFISAMSNHFCNKCNRLRLTSDGKLRSCLLSDFSLPLRDLLRNGCFDSDIYEIFINSVKYKRIRHNISFNLKDFVTSQMSNIGG